MTSDRTTIGWREWVALPDLGVPAIKVKVDTGARTSALHAHNLVEFERDGSRWVRFSLYPLQRTRRPEIVTEAPVFDQRPVTDSGGHREKRYVIRTDLSIAGLSYPIELTVTRRDTMLFRMLLGRTALRGRFNVDPERSFVLGRDELAVFKGEPSK